MAAYQKRNQIVAQRIVSAIIFLSIIVAVSYLSYRHGFSKGVAYEYLRNKKPVN
jgi:hypothetical protein